jgi:hypothetical protein
MAGLVRVGTLPVSAVNVGLAASLGGLSAEASKLGAEIAELTLLAPRVALMSIDFPPNVPALTAAVAVGNNPADVIASLSTITITGAETSLELGVELGLIEGQIAALSPLVSTFSAGVNAPGIAGWSYAGRAQGFGSELERSTRTGFGRTAAADQVQAVIIATESFSSWGSFSQSVNTGTSARAPAAPGSALLAFHGELGGGSWNTGVARLLLPFEDLLGELEGAKAAVDAQLGNLVGIGLPDPQVLVDAGVDAVAELGIDGLIENLVDVDADLPGAIAVLQGKLDANLSLAADIGGQLSAGGLTFWSYVGSASGLGAALRDELALGLPGGSGPDATAYGLVLAGRPASMGLFGNIFKTS